MPRRRGCGDSPARRTIDGDRLLAEVGVRRDACASRVRLPSSSGCRSTWRGRRCCRCDGCRPDAPGLFPALEADLEVAPLPPDRTQLAMSARYLPPLGSIGKVVDRAVLYPRCGGHAQGLPGSRGRRPPPRVGWWTSGSHGTSPRTPTSIRVVMKTASAPRDAGRRPRDRARRHPGDAAMRRTTSS